MAEACLLRAGGGEQRGHPFIGGEGWHPAVVLRGLRHLDDTHELELRRLAKVDVLIIDDFGLRPLSGEETSDLFELVTERHQAASMVITSNREPSEWLSMLADPLLAQALVDRFTNNAYDLVIEGESYRQRQKPRLSPS